MLEEIFGREHEQAVAVPDLCGRGSPSSAEKVNRLEVVMAAAEPKPDFEAEWS